MKKIIVLLSIVAFLQSCSKSNTDGIKKGEVHKNLPTFESLFSFFSNKDLEGSFLLQSNTPLGYTDLSKIDNPINITGGFYESKGSSITKAGGKTSFENIEVSCGQYPSYSKKCSLEEGKSLFGKKISISLIKPERGSNSVLNNPLLYQSGYIPQLFTCTNVFPENTFVGAGDDLMSGNKVQPGFQFTWNPDPQNQKGVFIFFEYNPDDLLNEKLKAAYPNKTSNAVLVDDIGSYTLTDEMFADIPLNAKMDIYIGRGNFEILTDAAGVTSNVQFTAVSYKYGNLYYGNQ